MIDSKIPSGPLEKKWDKFCLNASLVNPSNRSKFKIIVVGTGLAGAGAASSLAEQGYQVISVCLQDSPRRAHSVAAQGGVNAAKNYQNDGDSIWRLFKDTIKGGDFRSREANVYRLAELSNLMIDHCVALGIPFAREYSGYLDNRSFGGAQLRRTFYARGQTGQQLLLGVYSSLLRQVHLKKVTLYTRHSLQDYILDETGRVRGVILKPYLEEELISLEAHAVVLASGGYSNVYYLSTNAASCNGSALIRAHELGAYFANPSFTQIHPTCIPVAGEHQSKLTLMSESLRNDGRVWVPLKKGDQRSPQNIPESERDYYLERLYPSFGNLVPRDLASRQAKFQCDEGRGAQGLGVYLDFQDALKKLGQEKIQERYGNLFEMYEHITGVSPYQEPMRIYPAPHYTMGGLWVNYELMSNLKGLFVLGEANFSDHGANRLGASALMQGLVDGLFIISRTLPHYLANESFKDLSSQTLKEHVHRAQSRNVSSHSKGLLPKELHKKIGKILWDHVGMMRTQEGLLKAKKDLEKLAEINLLISKDQKIYAQQVLDYLQLGFLMIEDALTREESCGSHFRQEYVTSDHEALRNDQEFSHVALWTKDKKRLQEELKFEFIQPTTRSYK